MTGFINLLFSFYDSIFGLFNQVVFDLAGYSVSLGAIVFVCIALTMALSIYWKGAKG